MTYENSSNEEVALSTCKILGFSLKFVQRSRYSGERNVEIGILTATTRFLMDMINALIKSIINDILHP